MTQRMSLLIVKTKFVNKKKVRNSGGRQGEKGKVRRIENLEWIGDRQDDKSTRCARQFPRWPSELRSC